MPQEYYHVYSLPKEILETLTPRHLWQDPERAPSPPAKAPPSTAQVDDATGAAPGIGSKTCNICLGAAFADLDEQRAHFRSDWHRYNVKMRLNGQQAVAEEDFGALVDGLDDSISGSASSSSEDGGSDSDAVDTLMSRHRTRRSSSPSAPRPNIPQTALVWFHSPPQTQLGIYKRLFPLRAPPESYLDELKAMQRNHGEHGRTWAMFMTAGGHFAGSIVRVSHPDEDPDAVEEGERQGADAEDGGGRRKKKIKVKKPKPEVEILKHKTFHRYTTRRKQGGSQSLNDQAKGNAKSAGAQLRRYGEQALADDIRALLLEWAEDIDACERIWIRASTSNRRIFVDFEGSPIAKGDDRLRTFPFPTRRPTQAEISRCLLELTRVKVSHLTEDILRAQDEAYLASIAPKPKPVPATAPEKAAIPVISAPKRTAEEEALKDRWLRAVEMIRKGRLDPLKAFLERGSGNLGQNGVNALMPDWIAQEAGERGRTLLQVAAHAGQEDVTRWLLEDAKADPTVPGVLSDASDAPPSRPAGAARTAYDLARTRGVRNVFRRCAAAHSDWWDWHGAGHVQSALTKEMEDERGEKKKARRKGLKDKIRERQAKEGASGTEEPVAPPKVEVAAKTKVQTLEGPRRLGGVGGGSESVAGLTPEMRAKVERERRARAAEARLKALSR
ncbi:hypothetical protein PUNSTDRAFT_73374 [Punctularia strigosozonata HHB-11173 SS5]|uniref:uncharacterized protein n=1 Tax=Punctularia strigosozonata (strain HHB-11173) TaxID=741275 RepID=UPI0004416D2A|nr:uncharacterized protein PUNSTDRAFT_73374 [Punctularia strigosozonata HHB-11173 SS5]EIN06119.1 hypothetical protein PUNSTDRAFT_73374 [Punctularia strigosozonata HHB-11173 SS5]